MVRFLQILAGWVLGRPKSVIIFWIVLVTAASAFIPGLHVSTDRNLLAGKDNASFVQREKVNRLFGTSLTAVIVLEGNDATALEQTADTLAAHLLRDKDKVADVFFRVDKAFFKAHPLLYMPKQQMNALFERLEKAEPILQLLAESNTRLENLAALSAMGATLPTLLNAEPPPAADETNASTAAYFGENDGKSPHLRILFVQPKSNSQSMEAVAPLTDLLRETARSVISSRPGVQAYVTGMPAIVTDEMRAVSRDCVVAGAVAGIGVVLIFMIAFRSVRVSLFTVIPLGAGLLLSAGTAGLLFGHLTLITSYFAAVLFGLGVDFSIHLVARFHEALRMGEDKAGAVRTALVHAGPAVTVGGATTMFAFLAIGFSDFKGFAEMGIISGLGVFLILLANLTLLPATLLLWHPGLALVPPALPQQIHGGIWKLLYRSGKVPAAFALLGTLGGITAAFFIKFDYGVENLLPAHAESVLGMKRLDRRTDFSMSYSIALSDSPDGAEALRKRFAALSTVGKAESISDYLPQDQKTRLSRLTDEKPLIELLRRAAANVANRVQVADGKAPLALPPETNALLGSLSPGLKRMLVLFDDRGIAPSDLPSGLRNRFISKDGKYVAVLIFPKGDIGDKDFFERHVRELLSVSKETTGHPITHLDFTHMVHRGFRDAFLLSTTAVILLILIDLRDRRSAALALVPPVMGISFLLLFMWIFDLKFNYANLMALPILIGTGVDYGAHLAHRAEEEGSLLAAARTTGRAIVLTGLTTLVGFGSLMFGDHWGVLSLGLFLTVGIGFSLLAALVVIPAAAFANGKEEP